MAQGANGTIRGYNWIEYRNPGHGIFRGLQISDAYFVGVSGDIDTAHGTHSAQRYEDIANQIIEAITWNEQTEQNEWPEEAQVHLPIGNKNGIASWIKAPDYQVMIDGIRYGLTRDETELWSNEAKENAAVFLQSETFTNWQTRVAQRDWHDMQNSWE